MVQNSFQSSILYFLPLVFLLLSCEFLQQQQQQRQNEYPQMILNNPQNNQHPQ